MCLQKMEGMVLSKSVSQKLMSALKKQNDFYDKQNLRELATEEFEQFQSMRNACVHYIKVPHIYFGTRPDVFAVAVSLLDVFLWKVKVTIKHMTIVSAACFMIACKMLEEEEVQPTTRQLASLPSHEWTANDLCRMELHILKKLDWNVSTVSYGEFLPLFAEITGLDISAICTDTIISLAERCLTHQSTILVKPHVLAYCLFNHAANPPWDQANYLNLDQLKSLSIYDINQCQKNLLELSSCQAPLFPIQVPRRSASFPAKVFNKPSENGSPGLPTIVEE